jgi:hypothetical protein
MVAHIPYKLVLRLFKIANKTNWMVTAGIYIKSRITRILLDRPHMAYTRKISITGIIMINVVTIMGVLLTIGDRKEDNISQDLEKIDCSASRKSHTRTKVR